MKKFAFLIFIFFIFAANSGFAKQNSRIRVATDFAKANYTYLSDSDSSYGCWWLRSPHYSSSDNGRIVTCRGDADRENPVKDTIRGVIPALSISF